VEAGLGHMGIHRNLIHPQFGNFVLLGTVLMDREASEYNHPIDYNPCLECKLCVAACPVGAIGPEGTINFGSCFSHNYREFMGGFSDWVEQVADARNGIDYRRRVSDVETASMWQSLSHGANYKSAYCLFSLPFCIDWLTDGRLLVVWGREGLLMRRDVRGGLVTHADLTRLSSNAWNEIVVDGRGNAYINTGDAIALVTPEGSVRRVADGGAFPNGMVVTKDNSTLIMAESHGKKLTAFDITANGDLSNRRTWADLRGGVPDGITMDSEDTIWYADVPNKRCVRVREGGEVLQTIDVDRGCFACVLGGIHNRTLFMILAEWRGMDRIAEVSQARTGEILTIDATSPRAGWP
jgi:sugar lactone lactonase YvrE